MIPLPAEADEAHAALIAAREALGIAVDELNNLGFPFDTTIRFEAAHDDIATHVEHIDAIINAPRRRDAEAMEQVEERHIEAQMFPWVDDL